MDAKTWAIFTFLLAVARAHFTPGTNGTEPPDTELPPNTAQPPSTGPEPNATVTSTFYEGELPTINTTPTATLVGNSTENMTASQFTPGPNGTETPYTGLEPNTAVTPTFYEGELSTMNTTPNATLVGNSTENMTAFQVIMRANNEVGE